MQFDVVRGVDGGDWMLVRELTFILFCKVVRRMPSGKAVGEGGFSIELLRAADEGVLWLFYSAMMHDLTRGVISPNWPVRRSTISFHRSLAKIKYYCWGIRSSPATPYNLRCDAPRPTYLNFARR